MSLNVTSEVVATLLLSHELTDGLMFVCTQATVKIVRSFTVLVSLYLGLIYNFCTYLLTTLQVLLKTLVVMSYIINLFHKLC